MAGSSSYGVVERYGLDAELAAKREAKYDAAMEHEAAAWISSLLEDDSLNTGPLATHLKDGSVLCRLLNAIQPGLVPRFTLQPTHILEERENIVSYLKGCSRLGVPGHDLFTLSDVQQSVHDKAAFASVLQNIYAVGRHAQAVEGYTGPRLGVKFTTTLKQIEQRRKKREAEQIEQEAIQWARDQELLERRQKYEEKRKTAVLERMIAEDERALARRRRRGGRPDPRVIGIDRDPENEATAVFGMDKELQEAQEASYDIGLEVAVLDWLEATTGLPVDYLYESLRDGVVLCRLINKIRPNMIPRISESLSSAGVGLQARENVKNYLRACEALGVKKTELFIPSDLCERQNLVAVINNITALARIANSTTSFTGPKFDRDTNYDEIIKSLPPPPVAVAEPDTERKRPKLLKSYTERFSPTKLEPLSSAEPTRTLQQNTNQPSQTSLDSVRSVMEEKKREIERLKEAKRQLEEKEAQRRAETSKLKEEQNQEAAERVERQRLVQLEAEERKRKHQEALEREREAHSQKLAAQEAEKRLLEQKRKDAVRAAKRRQQIQDLVDSGLSEEEAAAQVDSNESAQAPKESTVESAPVAAAVKEDTSEKVFSNSSVSNETPSTELIVASGVQADLTPPEDVVQVDRLTPAAISTHVAQPDQPSRSIDLVDETKIAMEREAERLRILELEKALEAQQLAEREAFAKAAAKREAELLAASLAQKQKEEQRRLEEEERQKRELAEQEEKLRIRAMREEAVRKAKQRQLEEEQAAMDASRESKSQDLALPKESPVAQSAIQSEPFVSLDEVDASTEQFVLQRRPSREKESPRRNELDESSLLSLGTSVPSTPLLASRSSSRCPCCTIL